MPQARRNQTMHRPSIVLPLALLVTTLHAFAQDAKDAAPPREPAGMEKLFNGKDLAGWDGDPRLWSVKDGVVRGETSKEKPAKGNHFLIWKEGTLKESDLRLSFRMNASNNSGIQYRSRHIAEGKVNNPWV